jgi:hypothetical protein
MGTEFRRRCEFIWPDNTSSRLARASGHGHRAAQKMLAGEIEVPPEVSALVILQEHVLKMYDDPMIHLRKTVDDVLALGVHSEAVASRLSILYRELTEREIS